MSSNLLILHTWPPGCAGRALDRAVFAANVPEARRLVLNDPMHGLRSRFPAALDPLSEELRVVTGRLPFGYLDGQRDRILHVCVISDPELAFLRFARLSVVRLGRACDQRHRAVRGGSAFDRSRIAGGPPA